MNFFLRYLRDHSRLLLAQILFVSIFAAVFALYHLPLAAVLYPSVLCVLAGILITVRPLQRAVKKHKKLTELQAMSRNTLLDELPVPEAIAEDDYQQLIDRLCQEMRTMEYKTAQERKERLDYYTVWVHQIKTPIASMRLHLKTEDTPLSRKLTSDLLHIEQYVEMVLTYLRMGSDSTDYVFREVMLDDLIRENIRKYRGDFILKDISLQYTSTEKTVISDEKWLSFVIGQILSNALKYTVSGSVTIFMEQKTLRIRDTGIGIAPEDLPRIFEKGYTGYNGRYEQRASGIGLYLCKQICDQLGHRISVSSVPDVGTTVQLSFDT